MLVSFCDHISPVGSVVKSVQNSLNMWPPSFHVCIKINKPVLTTHDALCEMCCVQVEHTTKTKHHIHMHRHCQNKSQHLYTAVIHPSNPPWDLQHRSRGTRGAVLASDLRVCCLFSKRMAGGQTQHHPKASGFCLCSAVIAQGWRTIQSHLTLMQLSCLCRDVEQKEVVGWS